MKVDKKNRLFLFFPLLFIFLGAVSFVFATNGQPLETTYLPVPGAETPITTETFLPNYIKYFFNFSLLIATMVASLATIFGGVRYLTSAGNPAIMKDAKDQIFAGLLGLVVLSSSYLVLTTINPKLVIISPPPLENITTPKFTELTPAEQAQETLTAKEIPIGTLINGANYSNYSGLLDQERMELIKEILDEVKNVYLKITTYSQELISLSAQCNAIYTIARDPKDDVSWCDCIGEPCLNRSGMNTLRLKISTLSVVLDVFIKGDERTTYIDPETGTVYSSGKNWKVRDFINNFPSNDVLIRSLAHPSMYGACQYQAGSACEHGCPPGTAESIIRSCLLSSVGNTTLSDDLRKELEKMVKIEEKGGELEDIKKEMEKDLQRLEEGEKMMKECPGQEESAFLTLLHYPDFWRYKEALVNVLKVIKDITVENPWKEIKVEKDPSTFYCTVALISAGKLGIEEIPIIEQGEGGPKEPKTFCKPEIPLGRLIDNSITIGWGIMEAITELLDSVRFQIESISILTNLTDFEWQNCGKTWKGGFFGNIAYSCPMAARPCGYQQICPMNDINGALVNIKKNVACLLKKKGEVGITTTTGEQWMCCDVINYLSCLKTEGPYGRLLGYYEESKKIIKDLDEAREKMAECSISAEDLAKTMSGEEIPRKELINCADSKNICSDIEEQDECYGGGNTASSTDYFCAKTGGQ